MNVIGQPQFITFRLRDSLPPNRPFPATSMSSGEAFLAMDRLLDEARCGPTFLRQPVISQVVLDSIYRGAELGTLPTAFLGRHAQSCPFAPNASGESFKAARIDEGR
jgi:hypothetical protein